MENRAELWSDGLVSSVAKNECCGCGKIRKNDIVRQHAVALGWQRVLIDLLPTQKRLLCRNVTTSSLIEMNCLA
jgi:hypothetical protein